MPICKVCKTKFEKPKISVKKKIYCSRKCNVIAWAIREQKKMLQIKTKLI